MRKVAAPPPAAPPHGPPRKLRKAAVWRNLLLAGVLIGLAFMAFLAGYLERRKTEAELERAAALRRTSPPLVNAAKVKQAPSQTTLALPANITPITEAYVFARAAGFLKCRYVDIGDRVRQGQLLAEIDAPDLDQQVVQAEAAVTQSEAQLGQSQATQLQLIANRDLADVTWKRYKVLVVTGAVSKQDADTQEAAYKAAVANVAAGEKNIRAAEDFVRVSKAALQRLYALQGFKRVTSPFSGVVTARNVDVGALISAAGESQGPARPDRSPTNYPAGGEIFRVAEIGKLRILVPVPQRDAPGLHVGQSADVTAQEFPNRKFAGRLTRTSSSLDDTSRTLLAEVQVSNPAGMLLPGMYVLVNFVFKRVSPPLLVPDAAVVVEAKGTMVAVLRPLTPAEKAKAREDGFETSGLRRVHYEPVELGRNYGIEQEIHSGLKPGEEVAVNPGDAVQEGAIVQIAAPAHLPEGG